MKHEFNEDKELIFLTSKDGKRKAYLRAWVKSFEPVTDDPSVRSKVVLHPDEKGVEVLELLVAENCNDILDIMHGEPSEDLREEWRVQIIEERQAHHKEALEKADRDYAESCITRQRRFDRIEVNIAAQFTEPKLFLQNAIKRIENSDRLKLAQKLHEQMNDPSEPFMRRQMFKVGFHVVALREAELFALIPQHQNRLDWMQAQIKRNRKAEERETEDARLQYVTNRERLEKMSRDPQMNDRDRLILLDKINKYRQGHSEPEFRFRREEASERYRPEREVVREESRQRYDEILKRTRDQGMYRGLRMELGRER